MPNKPPTKRNLLRSEFAPREFTTTAESIAEYTPAGKKTEKSVSSAARPRKAQDAVAYSPIPGARLTPTYIERTPAMWAVGEVDIKAISDDSLVANIAFAIGSFLLGFAINIFVDYAGIEKLTDIGAFMLHKAMPLLILFSIVFYAVGGLMTHRKNAIWAQIKKESKAHETI